MEWDDQWMVMNPLTVTKLYNNSKKQMIMKKIKIFLACFAIAGLALLNFMKSDKHFSTCNASSSGTSTEVSSCSTSTEPEKWGYNPKYYDCSGNSSKRQIVCGNIVKNGSEPECMNSDC